MASVWGVVKYEFKMQVQRTGIWVSGLGMGLVTVGAGAPWAFAPGMPAEVLVPSWAQKVAQFLPLGLGLVLADRLARDRRIGFEELAGTQPVPLRKRLAGKFLGAFGASLLPVLGVYALGVGFELASSPTLRTVSLALAAFAAIVLPGLVFVAGFSLACPAVMPVPLYQVFFTGYWFWGNFVNPKAMPTLAGTILTPVGKFAAAGLFGIAGPSVPSATPAQATASIVLLVVGGLVPLFAVHRYLEWQRARQ